MARKPRFVLPGVPQHVIQRGNNRTPCFYATADYEKYLLELHEAAEKNNAAIHAYVLMTNHVHLLATPRHPFSITHMMQDLGRKYVRYINRTYRRTGTLWEGRFKACLVDSEQYLLTCMRYIELNPVRANMVTHPGEYRWSSYAHNAHGKPDGLIQPHPIYSGLAIHPEERRFAYRQLFRVHQGPAEIQDIRNALNQELVLGRDDFKNRIAQMTKRRVRAGVPGRPEAKEQGAIYYVL